MKRTIYLSLISLLLFAITSGSYAQNFQMDTELQKIRQAIIRFSTKFSSYYDVKATCDENDPKCNPEYKGPLRLKDPLEGESASRDIIPPFIRIKQYPIKDQSKDQFDIRSNFNTTLQVGDVKTVPLINAESAQSLVLDALQSIFYTLPDEDCEALSKSTTMGASIPCQSRSDILKQMEFWLISQPYTTNPGAAGVLNEKTYAMARKIDPTISTINAALSLDGLLGPLGYPGNEGQEQPSNETIAATRFIKLVTQEILPLKLKGSVAASERNEYLAQLRSYASQQSVALSNYYQMLARRVRTKAEGEKDSKSQWEREEERVLRRFERTPSDKKTQQKTWSDEKTWREQMDAAPPAIVQREMLYLLAEINYQLLQMRLEQERLLATNSATLSLMVQTNVKPILSQQTAQTGQSPTTPGTAFPSSK